MFIYYSDNPQWHKIYSIENTNIIRPYLHKVPIDRYNDFSKYTTNPLNTSKSWKRNNVWNILKNNNNSSLMIRIIKFENEIILNNKKIAYNCDMMLESDKVIYDGYFNIDKIIYNENGLYDNFRAKIIINDNKFKMNLKKTDNYWFHIIPAKNIELFQKTKILSFFEISC